ncbi:hypothetical protein BURPS1106A_A1552 [Burkholderia pseudomallei 1106a]|uniref:Uncharacterized protein n=1 Tax=Burkholderia pseudomallei (strain 1106a) TaxID=357348 RepID=A3P5H6_BURP0|nr:hypothetical protein BURPS1106A_A1552 [Burkholderia pseudomallei 1106a]
MKRVAGRTAAASIGPARAGRTADVHRRPAGRGWALGAGALKGSGD